MKKSLPGLSRSRRKFLRYFRGGFRDETYFEWERGYKEHAHREWLEVLAPPRFKSLLARPGEVAAHAVRIESRTNLLFSFEKMALRDAVKSAAGAKLFATALYDFLHGAGSDQARFEKWCDAIAHLPRRQTRVLTWPLVTVWDSSLSPAATFSSNPTSPGAPPPLMAMSSLTLQNLHGRFIAVCWTLRQQFVAAISISARAT